MFLGLSLFFVERIIIMVEQFTRVQWERSTPNGTCSIHIIRQSVNVDYSITFIAIFVGFSKLTIETDCPV